MLKCGSLGWWTIVALGLVVFLGRRPRLDRCISVPRRARPGLILDQPTASSVSGGPYGTTWSDALDAHFEGTPGNVTISGSIAAASFITFNVDGYTLSGGTINLTGAGGMVTTDSGTDAISSVLTGTGGLTKLGTGMLLS